MTNSRFHNITTVFRPLGWVLLSLAVVGFTVTPASADEQNDADEASEGVMYQRVLPLKLARRAANRALAACERDGFRVSVAVVDSAGLVKALIKGDGAGPHTLDSASRKAYTSASLRRSTAELVEVVVNNPATEGLRDMNENILILAGGLPIFAGDEVVGGIGVGGAPGGNLDEACAQKGIDSIQDALDEF